MKKTFRGIELTEIEANEMPTAEMREFYSTADFRVFEGEDGKIYEFDRLPVSEQELMSIYDSIDEFERDFIALG